jgi:7,8-dihydropterin-6-yl-methyl-4-(beta-D-ribofuranosyl)aminobenzene 5'-phosphate synthase
MIDATVTILVDNFADRDLIPEHGFSLWIEAGGEHILFDTGQSNEALQKNAKTLGIDLSITDRLILSHGHYDHTGGIPAVAESAPQLKIHFHPALFSARYSVREGIARPIGMTAASISSLQRMAEKYKFPSREPVQLSDRVFTSGEIRRTCDFERIEEPFYLDGQGTVADPVADDQAVYIKTTRGLLVLTGCCHAGVINTLRHIQKISGEKKIHSLIGGLHLRNCGSRRLEQTIDELRQLEITQIIACHCTGENGVEQLSGSLHCLRGYAGLTISL